MVTMTKAVLFLNGEEPKDYTSISRYDKIYCTDGAFDYLNRNNIVPDVVFGDMDSITSEHISSEVVLLSDQDYTDFEKSIIEIKKTHMCIDVFGGSGKEQDHFLGNLSVALKYRSEVDIHFYDEFQSYRVVKKNETIKDCFGKNVSLIPFSEARNVSTKGLKYELNNETLVFDTFISIRNQSISDEIEISYTSGNLFIFMEN